MPHKLKMQGQEIAHTQTTSMTVAIKVKCEKEWKLLNAARYIKDFFLYIVFAVLSIRNHVFVEYMNAMTNQRHQSLFLCKLTEWILHSRKFCYHEQQSADTILFESRAALENTFYFLLKELVNMQP